MMQDASSRSASTDSYDAPEAAGRAASIMSLLVPDLRLFIKRCGAKHMEQESVVTTPKKKKKKAVTPPAKQQLSVEAQLLMSAIVSGSAEPDFAAGVKFIDQHWKLVFEVQVGMYAPQLKAAISTALVCRNKVAHQETLSDSLISDCFDALGDLAVLLCAEKATKLKIRSLLSQKSSTDTDGALQQSLDAFSDKHLKRAREHSMILKYVGTATAKLIEQLEDEGIRSSWLVETMAKQVSQSTGDRAQVSAIAQAQTSQTQSITELRRLGRRQEEALKPRLGWREDNLIDKLLKYAKQQEKRAENQENLAIELVGRLKALSLQSQEATRVLEGKRGWPTAWILFGCFVAFNMVGILRGLGSLPRPGGQDSD